MGNNVRAFGRTNDAKKICAERMPNGIEWNHLKLKTFYISKESCVSGHDMI